MHYSVAMAQVRGGRTAARPANPDVRIAYRFGNPVLLNPDPTASPTYISWTPREQDMKADDWEVYEPDGTTVPPPRSASGTAVNDPPLDARGGHGTGTGWRRA